MKLLVFLSIILLISGCASNIGGTLLPESLGEKYSGYGYIPLDGLPVNQVLTADSCSPWKTIAENSESSQFYFEGELSGADPFKPLLETLPDISVRFAVGSFEGNGGITFGPTKITAKGKSYRAVLDYVNIDVVPQKFNIMVLVDGNWVKPSETKDNDEIKAYKVEKLEEYSVSSDDQGDKVTIPVYIGIGMRLSADVTAVEGGVPLTSLGAIAFEAKEKRLSGTLTVQTIGITGESIATSLPLPSSLDQTTIENGILAIGSSRAVVYRPLKEGSDNTITTTPRVVGLYSPIGSDPKLVNAIYSALSSERPDWRRPCRSINES